MPVQVQQGFQGRKGSFIGASTESFGGHSDREVYLDYKQVDLVDLAAEIQKFGVGRRVIFCHRDHENCKMMKRLSPEIRTMLWIPDKEIDYKFEEVLNTGFEALDIVQIHLADAAKGEEWRYRVQRPFLLNALEHLTEAGLELEVLPFYLDQDSLFGLLDMGIKRFAVDEPKVFVDALDRYFNNSIV
jgi:glycerophosphoryl diester phosphodiesterase